MFVAFTLGRSAHDQLIGVAVDPEPATVSKATLGRGWPWRRGS
jgi:hypothetical protein